MPAVFDFCRACGRRFWGSYGPLITTVIEALLEFAGVIVILKYSRWFVEWAAPPDFAYKDLMDRAHAYAFLAVWLVLVATFVVYAGMFGFKRFWARVGLLFPGSEKRLKAVEDRSLYNDAITLALAASTPAATYTDKHTALGALQMAKEKLGEAGLTDRRLNLGIARLHRRVGRLDNAIKAASDFIAEKERRNQVDVDLADAYYNRACYHVARMKEDHSNPEVGAKERELAYSDLEISLKRHPANVLDAAQDEDFTVLRNEERFKALLAQKQEPQGEAPGF